MLATDKVVRRARRDIEEIKKSKHIRTAAVVKNGRIQRYHGFSSEYLRFQGYGTPTSRPSPLTMPHRPQLCRARWTGFLVNAQRCAVTFKVFI